MASARETVRPINFVLKVPRWSRLGIVASLLGILFALSAFVMLVLHDRGHANIMVHDQPGIPAPTPKAAPVNPAPIAPTPASHTAVTTSPGKNDFSLTRIDRPIAMGSIRLRLLKTDMAKGLYDVNVISAGRNYAHRRLKVTQPLWIATSRGSGSIELVVDTIGKDSVSGYWKESDHSAQVSARARGRHR